MVFGKAANLVESDIHVHFNSSAGGSPVGGFQAPVQHFGFWPGLMLS